MSNNIFFLFTFIHNKMFNLSDISYKWLIGGIIIGILLYILASYLLGGPLYNLIYGKKEVNENNDENNNDGENERESLDLNESVEKEEVISRPVMAKMTLVKEEENNNVRFEEINNNETETQQMEQQQMEQQQMDNNINQQQMDNNMNQQQMEQQQMDNEIPQTEQQMDDDIPQQIDNESPPDLQMDVPEFEDSHSDTEDLDASKVDDNNDEFME